MNAAIKWFIENKMFVKLGKFQATLLDKQKNQVVMVVNLLLALRKSKLFFQLTY